MQSGTLSSLLTLSDYLPKQDTFFTQTVSKLLDTLRSLLNDDPQKLELHTRVSISSPGLNGEGHHRWEKDESLRE